MNEIKVKGIVLKLTDYKDADKLASIFTLEEGKILAKFVGVKREKAKLKSVAQPFVLAEFNINIKANKRTITSAYMLDAFPQITSDYARTMNAFIVLDIINSILPESKVEKELFVLTVNALKNIETKNPYIANIDFIINFLSFNGVEISFLNSKQVYFDKMNGEFTDKKDTFSQPLDMKVYSCLYNIAKFGQSNIDIDERVLKQALRLLHNVIFIKMGEDIKSFQYI